MKNTWFGYSISSLREKDFELFFKERCKRISEHLQKRIIQISADSMQAIQPEINEEVEDI